MKAEDLMINDWVMEDNHKLQVVKLTKNGEYPNCNPIPLTPEILEKNGFDTSPFSSFFKNEEMCIEIYIHRTGLDITRGYYNEEDETFSLPPVRYVHQYQQSLRLCGLTELANTLKIE